MCRELVPTSGALDVGALLLFFMPFAVTYGPVTFLIIVKMFPVAYKGTAVGFCSLVLATTFLGLGAFFLLALKVFVGYVYVLFVICVSARSWLVYTKVPETRNLTLDEVCELLS